MRQYTSYFYALMLLGISFSLAGQKAVPALTIKKITYEGNYKTKEEIISRELSFREGDRFRKSAFDSLFHWNRIRIYNTNLFNEVTLTLQASSDSTASINIKLDERWYLYPTPIFRLVDRNFNDWWVNRDRDLSRVNYGIKINQFNFRGRREFVRLLLQTGFTNVLGLRYSIPYIDKKQRHGLLVDLSYFDAKNVAYTTVDNIPRFTSGNDTKLRSVYRNILRHSYRSSFYSFHRTWVGHVGVSIADTLALLNPNYLGEGRTLQRHFYVGHSLVYDKRDNVNYPTKGLKLGAGIFKHGLGIFNDGVDFWRVRMSAAKYWDLSNGFFAASDVSLLSTFPSRRAYFNYYQIGILLESLRGYDLNVIEGSSYVIQRNELKYRLLNKKWNISKVMPLRQFQTFPFAVYGKIYFDQGWARSYPDYEGSDLLTDRHLFSYGTGLDLVLVNDLTLRLEYTRNALNRTYFFINFLALI